jgi:hypothetical protein
MVSLGLFAVNEAMAQCPGRWAISGRLARAVPGPGPSQITVVPVPNVLVKFKARWNRGCTGNCPWNDSKWFDRRTDENGRFTTSSVNLRDRVNCRKTRDIQLLMKSVNPFDDVSVRRKWQEIITVVRIRPMGQDLGTINVPSGLLAPPTSGVNQQPVTKSGASKKKPKARKR